MADPQDPDRLKRLEERIDALKQSQAETPHVKEHYSQAQIGWRMVTELVAGLLVGFAIGWGLDWLFGTLPFLTVAFLFFGFAAGVKVMLRSAQELQAGPPAPQTPPGDAGTDKGD